MAATLSADNPDTFCPLTLSMQSPEANPAIAADESRFTFTTQATEDPFSVNPQPVDSLSITIWNWHINFCWRPVRTSFIFRWTVSCQILFWIICMNYTAIETMAMSRDVARIKLGGCDWDYVDVDAFLEFLHRIHFRGCWTRKTFINASKTAKKFWAR